MLSSLSALLIWLSVSCTAAPGLEKRSLVVFVSDERAFGNGLGWEVGESEGEQDVRVGCQDCGPVRVIGVVGELAADEHPVTCRGACVPVAARDRVEVIVDQ